MASLQVVETEDFCQLIANDDSYCTVELEDKKPVVLGRGPLTAITDEHCSKAQVEVTADFSSKELHVRQLYHSCKAGNITLLQGECTTLGPGAKLELTEENYTYHLFFGKRAVSSFKGDETTLNESFHDDSEYRCSWKSSDSLLVMEYGPQRPSPLIAAFDLDGTIIKTKSGRLPFRTTPDDWMFWDPCVPKKLHTLSLLGYRVVIFTNQGGIPYGNPVQIEFQTKVQAVMKAIGSCPILLLASINDDNYRKPRPKMWSYFVHRKNSGEVNMNDSFFIGDAAGRIVEWKKGMKKDFSCSDRKFAANLSLSFHTPEEYFLGEPPCPHFSWEGFNPRTVLCHNEGQPVLEPETSTIVTSNQEVVVFVGCPASGKTTFYNQFMSHSRYHHVNRDKLGTWQKCVHHCQMTLERGYSVVVDNTNPDVESRARYIEVARSYKLPVRCMLFTTSLDHAQHNNRFRERVTKDPDYKQVPSSAFTSFQSKFVHPLLTEGFSEIIKITICFKFTDPKLKELYMQFQD